MQRILSKPEKFWFDSSYTSNFLKNMLIKLDKRIDDKVANGLALAYLEFESSNAVRVPYLDW